MSDWISGVFGLLLMIGAALLYYKNPKFKKAVWIVIGLALLYVLGRPVVVWLLALIADGDFEWRRTGWDLFVAVLVIWHFQLLYKIGALLEDIRYHLPSASRSYDDPVV